MASFHSNRNPKTHHTHFLSSGHWQQRSSSTMAGPFLYTASLEEQSSSVRPGLTSEDTAKASLAASSPAHPQGLTWQWGQFWWRSLRTLHSSGCGRTWPGFPVSLWAFSSAFSSARRQWSQAAGKQDTVHPLSRAF